MKIISRTRECFKLDTTMYTGSWIPLVHLVPSGKSVPLLQLSKRFFFFLEILSSSFCSMKYRFVEKICCVSLKTIHFSLRFQLSPFAATGSEFIRKASVNREIVKMPYYRIVAMYKIFLRFSTVIYGAKCFDSCTETEHFDEKTVYPFAVR